MKMSRKTEFCGLALTLRSSSEHAYQKKPLVEYFEGKEKKIPFSTNFGSFWGPKGLKMTP